MTVAPEQLVAYADGELDPTAARRIERAMADDPELARAVERHRALRRRLEAHFDPILDEPVPERLSRPIATVDTSLERRRAARWLWAAKPTQWGAIAAALVLGLFTGQHLPDGGPVAVEDGAMLARGDLARALQTQLASTQDRASPTRIRLTFRSTSGAICRSFERTDLSGIACRDEGRWRLERTFGGIRDSEFRQASSGDLAEAAARMMGPMGPLGAAEERRLVRSGW